MSKDLKILITGASGFIGSHLIRMLRDDGADVIGCGRKYCADLELCDLTDSRSVEKLFASRSFDCVVHLASTLRRGERSSAKAELKMARELIARMNAPSRMIYLTTADEYDGSQNRPIDELCAVSPLNDHGKAKRAARRLLQQECRENRIALQVVRPFSVYGAGQPDYMFMSLLLSAIGREASFTYSAHQKIRDFIYIEDLCRAITMLIHTPPESDNHIYNVGTGIGTTLESLVSLILKLTGSRIDVHRSYSIGNSDPHYLVADNARIRRHTGWAPKVGLDQGVSELIAGP